MEEKVLKKYEEVKKKAEETKERLKVDAGLQVALDHAKYEWQLELLSELLDKPYEYKSL